MCNPATRRFARALRREVADAERLLWHHLRDGRLADAIFLRDAPVGPFVVDFLAPAAAVVVEVGATSEPGGADLARSRFLARRGFRVLRPWHHDVLVRTDAVLERIGAALAPQCNRPGARRAVA